MGAIRWNRNPADLTASIQARLDGLRAEALVAVSESVHEGEVVMRNYIENAETPTGQARAAQGGSAGRIENGQMINSTNSRASMVTPNEILGEVGWPEGEEYYLFQENGTRNIEPMLALFNGFLVARERLVGRLLQMVRGH